MEILRRQVRCLLPQEEPGGHLAKNAPNRHRRRIVVIILQSDTTKLQYNSIIAKVEELGFTPHPIVGVEKTVIAVIGDKTPDKIEILASMVGVDRIVPIMEPFKLAGKEVMAEPTIIELPGPTYIGGERVAVGAGPCAVESREQYLETARLCKAAGAVFLRGSIFKPRTSPHDFQGLREDGVDLLQEAHETVGLPIVTEVMDPEHVELLDPVVDIFQIGARNMQNFSLLTKVGRTSKPVLLKRGMSATVEDLLMAAEYIIVAGNDQVVLCERGIRTFETATRNTLDISAVPVLKRLSHLPVIVDPSHAGGHRYLVPALAKAAVAAGADGLLIEVHRRPEEALVDGPQALSPDDFAQLMRELKGFAQAAERSL